MWNHRRTTTSLLREAYHQCFRVQLRLRASALAAYESLANPAASPLPPPLLRYKVGERLSARTFLDVGKASAERITGVLAERGLRLEPGIRILDFGCGKTLRWLTELGGGGFFGSDVDSQAIAWCTHNLGDANFVVNGEWPPLPFADDYFDAVYAISVFTRLD